MARGAVSGGVEGAINFPADAQVYHTIVLSTVLIALRQCRLLLIALRDCFVQIGEARPKSGPAGIKAVPEINFVRFHIPVAKDGRCSRSGQDGGAVHGREWGPKVFTYSQPVRVPGAWRDGKLQGLIWLRE